MTKHISIFVLLLLAVTQAQTKDRDRNVNTTPAMTEKAISAGFNHTLIIQEGMVFAWGENMFGQLGDSTISPSGVQVPVVGLDHIIAVSAGRRHSMALRADGTVFVWGDNVYGQLGTFGAGSPVPVALPGVSDIIDIQAGDFHCLALKSDGTVISWGINNLGELGQGFTSPLGLPGNVVNASGTGILDGITLISAGARHSLAIQNGRVLAWGDNLNTQLGRSPSSFTFRSNPVVVRKKGTFFGIPLSDVISLSAGETHSMAIDVEGNLWTWGEGIHGQLGIGGPINPADPTTFRRQDAENVGSNVRTMAAGYKHSIFIDSKGELHFFGANFLGQLGIPLTTTQVESAGTVAFDRSVALACGTDFTIVLRSDGSIVGAGDNAHNQFGLHSGSPAIDVFTNFFVKNDKIAQVANQSNSFVLRADGTVWSFGRKDYVGFLAAADIDIATRITVLNDIIALGATYTNAFALDVYGKVWAWGENVSGVCGQGTTTAVYTTPQLISSLSDIVYIDGTIQGFLSGGGGSSACAIDVNGNLFAWGNNNKQMLGDGTTTKRLVPVRSVATTKDFSVSMSEGNTFVLNADNTVEVWGDWTNDGSTSSGSYAAVRPINSSSRFKSITTTRALRMGLLVNGTIEIWGGTFVNSNNFFKICKGTAPYDRSKYPSQIYENSTSSVLIDNVRFIESGDYVGYFIKADGSTWSWGQNREGQLGRGYRSTEESIPSQVSCVAPGYSVSMHNAISFEHHALANRANTWIESWGANNFSKTGQTRNPRHPYVLGCITTMRIATNPVLGIDESEMLIYPNPASETLHVDLSGEMMQGGTELRLMDASGRTVFRLEKVIPNIDLDVSHLEEGLYILEIGAIKRRILIRK